MICAVPSSKCHNRHSLSFGPAIPLNPLHAAIIPSPPSESRLLSAMIPHRRLREAEVVAEPPPLLTRHRRAYLEALLRTSGCLADWLGHSGHHASARMMEFCSRMIEGRLGGRGRPDDGAAAAVTSVVVPDHHVTSSGGMLLDGCGTARSTSADDCLPDTVPEVQSGLMPRPMIPSIPAAPQQAQPHDDDADHRQIIGPGHGQIIGSDHGHEQHDHDDTDHPYPRPSGLSASSFDVPSDEDRRASTLLWEESLSPLYPQQEQPSWEAGLRRRSSLLIQSPPRRHPRPLSMHNDSGDDGYGRAEARLAVGDGFDLNIDTSLNVNLGELIQPPSHGQASSQLLSSDLAPRKHICSCMGLDLDLKMTGLDPDLKMPDVQIRSFIQSDMRQRRHTSDTTHCLSVAVDLDRNLPEQMYIPVSAGWSGCFIAHLLASMLWNYFVRGLNIGGCGMGDCAWACI